MKRMFWMYLSLTLLATPVHATSSDTTKVYLGSGETAVVISDAADPVTYRVTDRDMARWASMVNRPRTIVRTKYLVGPTRVVHDTIPVVGFVTWLPVENKVGDPYLWPGTRGIIPWWWPLLFVLALILLIAIALAGGLRGRDGRDGRDGIPGRDGREQTVAQNVTPEGHWLSVGTLPEGTEITIKRDRQPPAK